jgi:hypothetical protein
VPQVLTTAFQPNAFQNNAFQIATGPLGTYRLRAPHYLRNGLGNTVYQNQGYVVNEGVDVPIGWIPTLAVDPLNSPAVTSYYNAGPRGNSFEDLNLRTGGFPGLPPGAPPSAYFMPVTYWKASIGNTWVLTGLGAGLPPTGG